MLDFMRALIFLFCVAVLQAHAASSCRQDSLPTSGDAILHAIAQGRIADLVACGLSIDRPIEIGGEPMTPLAFAASLGKPMIVEQVLSAGADPNFGGSGEVVLYPLDIALSAKKYAAARVLLNHGARADYRLPKSETSALMAIAFDGDPVGPPDDIVPVLLARGALLSAADAKGNTALHWAARAGNVGYVRRLLAQGADACALNLKRQGAAELVPANAQSLKKLLADACRALSETKR
jgi:ankyrin repeat protein